MKKETLSKKTPQERFNLKPAVIDVESLSLCRKPKSLVKKGNSKLAILRSNHNPGVETHGNEGNRRPCLTRQTTAEACSPSRIRHQDSSLGDLIRDLKPTAHSNKKSLNQLLIQPEIFDRNISMKSPIRSFNPSFIQSFPRATPQVVVDWKKSLMMKLMGRISQERKVSSPYNVAKRPDVSCPKKPVISVFTTSNKHIRETNKVAGRVSLLTPHN